MVLLRHQEIERDLEGVVNFSLVEAKRKPQVQVEQDIFDSEGVAAIRLGPNRIAGTLSGMAPASRFLLTTDNRQLLQSPLLSPGCH